MTDKKRKSVNSIEEEPLRNEPELNQKTPTPSKWRNMIKNITVEPLLAGLMIPSIVSRFAMGNLNLDKACRVNLQFDDEICDALIKKSSNNYTEYEKKVQELISSTDIWKSIINTTLPCLLIMFLGAWSDRTGKRKLIILLPMYGELLTIINNIINVYFFYEIPVQMTVFLETMCGSITGGWVTMFLGVFSYISDITKEETRTFRVGILNFGMTAGFPIGMALSGVLVKYMGYYALFSTTGAMFIVVVIYGTCFVLEPDDWLKKHGKPPILRPVSTGVSFFNLSHVSDTVAVAFRPRDSNRRIKLLLTLFSTFILYGPMLAEYGVFYLFVRNQLNWDMVKYGFYASYSIVLHSIGTMFSIIILSKRLQMEDSLLLSISVISKLVSSVWTAFVKTDIELYLIPAIEMIGACTFTSLRSIVSKNVDQHETAKVNSLFALTETLGALAFLPLYSLIYMKTLAWFPGTVFIASAVLTFPAFIIACAFYINHKRQQRRSKNYESEADEKQEPESKTVTAKEKELK